VVGMRLAPRASRREGRPSASAPADAAIGVFSPAGVAAAPVAVIVRTAGVAEDTYCPYLNHSAGIGDAVAERAGGRDLIPLVLRPENRVVRERTAARPIAPLAPTLAGVVADGVAAAPFCARDPRPAAEFILARFTRLRAAVGDPGEVPATTAAPKNSIVRRLGC
jgi:hypothetical protein